MLRNNLYWSIAFAIAIIPLVLSVNVQSQSTQNSSTESVEEIVVTGSRIARANNAESAVPLQVFSSDDFLEVGAIDLAEALAEIPGVTEELTARNSNTQIQNAGLSTISLRRLGDDRTLVLINGKRAVSNSGNNDRVSLSTLPTGLVERTEITTGGASAIYGSDAIAGVVNFLIEDDFEGFQIDSRYSTPDASGGDEARMEFKWGTNYSDGKGYFMLAGDFQNRDMIRSDSTRPETIAAIEFDDPSTSSSNSFADEINQPGCDPENEDRHCFLPSFSGSTPGGVFEGGDAWNIGGQWFNDQSLQPADRTGSQDFFGDFDGFDFRSGRTLIDERELFNIGAYTEYEFDSGLQGSVLLLHNEVETLTAGGFETLNDDDTFGINEEFEIGNISSSHPFIPAEVEETRSGSVSFDRRLVELGEQFRVNNRKTTRLIADLKGDFNDRFSWEAFATYGRFTQDNATTNEVNFLRSQLALDVESDGAGGFQCADADARAQGCVPLNIFGEGSISTEAANYIRHNGQFSQSRDQYTVGGYITGDLFEFNDRTVRSAFGVEFRREEQESIADPDGDVIGGLDGDPTTNDVAVTSLSTIATFEADYDVFEAYAELDVPLTDDISLQLAGRIGDYSTVGMITSWNIGGVWRPSSQFSLRTQFSRSQRAPNLAEFFSPPRPDRDDLEDTCTGLLPDGSGISAPIGAGGENADLAVITANCLADPAIQAFFADPDNAGEEFDPGNRVTAPNVGNSNLKEETADTYTVGAIFQPDAIEGLTLIVDYYNIEVTDAIDEVLTQDVVDQCYSATSFPNNRFCELITRSNTTGEVINIFNFQENLNEERVEGIDASLDWDFKLPKIDGNWDLDLRYSHYMKDEVRFTGIGGVELVATNLGEIGSAEDEFRARLGYSNNGWRFRYTMTYEQGGVDDLVNNPLPSDDRFFSTGSEMFHRAYLAYTFGEDNRYRIYGGIDNITDNLGPILPSGLENGDSRNLVSDLNDIDGRTFYLGFRIRL